MVAGMLYRGEDRVQRHGGCVVALLAIRVLTRVRLLVVKVLNEAVVSSRERAAKERTNPVDPVVTGKLCASDRRTKAASGVE